LELYKHDILYEPDVICVLSLDTDLSTRFEVSFIAVRQHDELVMFQELTA
jgi:hypothetical protein